MRFKKNYLCETEYEKWLRETHDKLIEEVCELRAVVRMTKHCLEQSRNENLNDNQRGIYTFYLDQMIDEALAKIEASE